MRRSCVCYFVIMTEIFISEWTNPKGCHRLHIPGLWMQRHALRVHFRWYCRGRYLEFSTAGHVNSSGATVRPWSCKPETIKMLIAPPWPHGHMNNCRAYQSTRIYREVKLRAGIIRDNELILLPGEKLYEKVRHRIIVILNDLFLAYSFKQWYSSITYGISPMIKVHRV